MCYNTRTVFNAKKIPHPSFTHLIHPSALACRRNAGRPGTDKPHSLAGLHSLVVVLPQHTVHRCDAHSHGAIVAIVQIDTQRRDTHTRPAFQLRHSWCIVLCKISGENFLNLKNLF